MSIAEALQTESRSRAATLLRRTDQLHRRSQPRETGTALDHVDQAFAVALDDLTQIADAVAPAASQMGSRPPRRKWGQVWKYAISSLTPAHGADLP